jgi:molybdate transport system ATP-binding protein
MSQPRWLLLDEPLAAVDQSARAKVLRMLGRLRDELGVPMLYVTHDIGEALELTDSFFLMADGTLSGPGELYKLAQEPGQFEHVDAIGIETILRATVLSDDASQAVCRAQMGPYAVTAPRNHARVGETIRLGVRPRDVLLAKERVDGLSARNVFDGRVVALRECDGHQLAEIDVGQPIVAEVTLDALSALGLEVGSSVTVYIKSTALRFRGVDGS